VGGHSSVGLLPLEEVLSPEEVLVLSEVLVAPSGGSCGSTVAAQAVMATLSASVPRIGLYFMGRSRCMHRATAR
jgi:hypothetical protein